MYVLMMIIYYVILYKYLDIIVMSIKIYAEIIFQ